MSATPAENINLDLNIRKPQAPETILEEIGIPIDTFAADAIQSTLARRAAIKTAQTSPLSPSTMGYVEQLRKSSGQAQSISPAARSGVYSDVIYNLGNNLATPNNRY